jgi:hypothetical protein
MHLVGKKKLNTGLHVYLISTSSRVRLTKVSKLPRNYNKYNKKKSEIKIITIRKTEKKKKTDKILGKI